MRTWWLCALVPLLLKVALSATTCDSTCQLAQINALISFYNTNGGSTWTRSSAEWAAFTPTTPFADVCSVLLATQTGYCCFTADTACGRAGVSGEGIAGLILPANNVKGTLPESFISALSPTILFVSLYGRIDAASPVLKLPSKRYANTLHLARQPAEWDIAIIYCHHDAFD